ncbi:hypothetical protein O181_077086 [Austropuccinia psidii MF-1]|uniref:Uncharacterized protein n=1 Tax=Austropuccinia psidii MF-1 TaxID=1389203 RepID=A0A9Q3IBS3_9BASI|nr:hypothetical protein [Austropuccinia psidii MF-1]
MHRLFGTNLSFFTAYNPQTDGLEERMIQALDNIIRIFCAYGQTPATLEKGWSPRLPADTPSKDLVDIFCTASSFKMMLDKVKHHAKQSMNDAFYYAKQKQDKSHKVPELKVWDLLLALTLSFDNIKGLKKLKDSYVEPFVIVALDGTNVVQVEFSFELGNEHSTFTVSLIKNCLL